MKAPVFFNALRAFEASARHRSFSAATAGLNVTPAAVGQLVRALEAWPIGNPYPVHGLSSLAIKRSATLADHAAMVKLGGLPGDSGRAAASDT